MIYLDSGATTLEKPPEVTRAMARAVGTMSSPGRGNYPASRRAEQTAFACREAAAGLFQVPTPDQVVFTSNATHGTLPFEAWCGPADGWPSADMSITP